MNTFDELIECLKDPDELWVNTRFTLDNPKRLIEIWVDGVFSKVRRPAPLRLSLYKRWVLWRAVCTARENIIHRSIAPCQPSATVPMHKE